MNKYLVLQKVLERGSFTKAAAELGYTQSSVSQLVASLENELGIKMLIRSRNGIRLTAEGQRVWPSIERMLNDYEMLEQKVVEVKGLKDGKIRIGAISSITTHWLPQLIRNFKQRYPDVEFVMYQGDYDSIPRWIKEGVVDIGFTTPRQSNGLTVVPLKKGEMQAIIPENHPLAKQPGKPLPLSALADQPLILLEEGTYSEPLAAFDRAGVKPKVEYRIHDDYTIMNMVEKGLGISILANLVLLRMPFHFVRRPLKPRIMREIGVAFKSRQELPLVCQKFVDEIISQRDQLP